MADSNQAVEQEDQQADATGHDSPEGKAQQREEEDPIAAAGDEQSEEREKAQEKEEQRQAAREKMDEIEENPPDKLEDWPDDAAKYETMGGAEGEHTYEEGPEKKLGPSSLRHLEDGGVTIEGEPVDDAEKYKGEPIPGGPTDPDAPQDLTTQKIRADQGRQLESEKGDDDGNGEDGGDQEEDES
jgi:hypothetical protein